MRTTRSAYLLSVATASLLFTLGASATQVGAAAQLNANATTAANPLHDTVLGPSDLQSILPPAVFFKGQSAPLQLRNAGGIHFTDGAYLFAALVDSSGYSSGVQEKYQAYFITETTLHFGEHLLNPGAYGVGFIANNKFVVMDIGGHDLFTVDSTRDEAIRHPIPLKILQTPDANTYRLYAGRMYVEFKATH